MNNNMVTCLRMQMSEGKLLCFTDSDMDVIYKNERYRSGSYFTPNTVVSSNELSEDNFSISGIIDGDLITKKSITAGNFSNSYIELFVIKNDKKNILKTGWIGDISYNDNKFTASINSLSSKTNNLIGKCYSPNCRAEFADQYCKLNKDNYSFSGEVTALIDRYSFIDSSRNEPNDYFSQGVLEFTSGENKGKKYNVSSFQEHQISIDSVISQKIQIGDKYIIIAGCNKSLHECIYKFSNAINFRGEPYIPSRHKLLAYN
ncbi:MAG: DUF2163 domain-containing protein [Rickettsiales bacterium]|nr:DUF2163 domain-containing protein [Rickettsiales bacterium]